jgi:hypothetical protein
MYKTEYKTDPLFVAGQDYQSAVDWARYSHKYFLHAKRNGFLMAAYEYKVDRTTFLERARNFKPKEK